MVSDWETQAKGKGDSILTSIPAKWRLEKVPTKEQQRDVTEFIKKFLSERELEITETDAVGITKHTTTGEWSAIEVAEAFCHRASLAHQLVSCLHETFFDAALADARKLDEFYAEHKKPVGPLHGLPVSLKDQFHVKGVETTMGYVGWIDTFEGRKGDKRQGDYESEMVRELRNLGAVLYVKTSVPHTLMCGETINNIIGYTCNPKNRELSSGGSSGGEGALIGLKGSPGGFGTDIGGSIRIPAAFNGLYGIRPSSGRMPYEGMANSMDGQNSVLSVVGPLATSIGGVKLLVKCILSQMPWLYDPLVVEMPWRDTQEQEVLALIKASTSGKSQLAFGILKMDGHVSTQPPVSRAMQVVADALVEHGHTVIEWKPPSHQRGLALTYNAWSYDGGKDIHAAFELSGEPIAKQVKMIYKDKPWTEFTATEIAANNIAKREYQKEYLDYWNSTAEITGTRRPVDGVLMPVAPYAAARPDLYRYYGYSAIVNGLDYTAVTIPVTTCDKKVDVFDESYRPMNDQDKEAHEAYDAEIYDGAHVSIQLVGRRFQEERMLALAEHIALILNK